MLIWPLEKGANVFIRRQRSSVRVVAGAESQQRRREDRDDAQVAARQTAQTPAILHWSQAVRSRSSAVAAPIGQESLRHAEENAQAKSRVHRGSRETPR